MLDVNEFLKMRDAPRTQASERKKSMETIQEHFRNESRSMEYTAVANARRKNGTKNDKFISYPLLNSNLILLLLLMLGICVSLCVFAKNNAQPEETNTHCKSVKTHLTVNKS